MMNLVAILLLTLSAYGGRCNNALKELLVHYQDQTKSMIESRLDNISNKHKFLRAFIPFYYQRAFEVRESLPVFKKLGSYKGTMVGDAHVENFGILVDNKGLPRLTINDYDDVAKGPLFLDVMRLSQSASYVSEISQEKMLKAYLQGLKGEIRAYSKHLKGMMKSSQKFGVEPKNSFIRNPDGIRFKSKDNPAFAVAEAELKNLKAALSRRFKNFQIHDAYRTMKESGGSAFLTRFQVLVESEGKIYHIEFKQITNSGVTRDWAIMQENDIARVNEAMKTYLGDSTRNFLDTTTLGGTPFQMRFKMKGNQGISLAEVKAKDLDDVIEDEFYTLGLLHRNSLSDASDLRGYTRDFESLSKEDWKESVKKLKKETDQFYKQVK